MSVATVPEATALEATVRVVVDSDGAGFFSAETRRPRSIIIIIIIIIITMCFIIIHVLHDISLRAIGVFNIFALNRDFSHPLTYPNSLFRDRKKTFFLRLAADQADNLQNSGPLVSFNSPPLSPGIDGDPCLSSSGLDGDLCLWSPGLTSTRAARPSGL